MATLFLDNAEIYGKSPVLLDGMYASIAGNVTLEKKEGLPAFYFPAGGDNTASIRKVLDANQTTIFIAARLRVGSLPLFSNQTPYIVLSDGGNTPIISLNFDSTGRAIVTYGAIVGGTELGRSSGPVLVANTWQHFEMKVVINATTGSVQVRYDDSDTPIINVSNVNTGSSPIAQFTLGRNVNYLDTWFTDVHVWNTAGTRNIDFLGDVSIATLWPNEDIQTGWTPNYRKKIGKGILATNLVATNGTKLATGLSFADSPSFEFGTGDFTMESFIRFEELPTGANRVGIFSKWFEVTDQRSYELSLCGPSLNSGHIQFRASTTGTAGSVVTLISQPWAVKTDTWYHVAIVRASGQTMLFIDGIMFGVPVADANNYYDGTAPFVLSSILASTTSITLDDSGVFGWFDETRISRVARYTVNFTPTTVAFGRTVGADPQFANVALLMGYDNGIADESSSPKTATGIGKFGTALYPYAYTPDDGSFQYETINIEDTAGFGVPRDDTHISASFFRADAILTLSSNPAVNNTVTIGNASVKVYKFVVTPSAANDVKIGVNIADSLFNLYSAINQLSGAGTLYGTGTTAHTEVYAAQLPSPQLQVLALLSGTGGNSIGVAISASGTWDAATLTGGANIPGPSSFKFTRLPPGVTTVRSIMTVTRAYKTEAGAAKMRTNFVGPSGTIVLGAERTLPVEPSYRTEVFEADPDTTGPITPATLVNGRIQFNRTE